MAYWSKPADVLVVGLMIDGFGRWDMTLNQFFVIATVLRDVKGDHTDYDGHNGVVRVLHTPNDRGFEGTEFVIDAVGRLRGEGLAVELVLLE